MAQCTSVIFAPKTIKKSEISENDMKDIAIIVGKSPAWDTISPSFVYGIAKNVMKNGPVSRRFASEVIYRRRSETTEK